MGTTADKLLYLQDTKTAIHDAIVAKGVTIPVGTPFRDYATKIGSITTSSGGSFVRPSEWLALPNNVNGTQKISILNAVFNIDENFVAFIVSGAYTVDWGDGTVENIAAGTKAQHKYDYSNANLNSNTVSSYGYKQCVITITPQVGNNLTSVNFNTYHSTIGNSTTNTKTMQYLDIRINGSLITNLILGLSISNYVKFTMLKQCLIGEININYYGYMFDGFTGLESVEITSNSANVTDMGYMHRNNSSLVRIPSYNFSSVTTLAQFASSCYSLKYLPTFNTTSVLTNLTSSFQNCTSLIYGANIANTNGVTLTTSMYSGCTSLISCPAYSLPAAPANIGITMYTNCSSLKSVPNHYMPLGQASNILSGMSSVSKCQVSFKTSFNISNAVMSATALNEMYTALPTVTGQTVTVTGNYGVAGDDPSIATAKGWTVTG